MYLLQFTFDDYLLLWHVVIIRSYICGDDDCVHKWRKKVKWCKGKKKKIYRWIISHAEIWNRAWLLMPRLLSIPLIVITYIVEKIGSLTLLCTLQVQVLDLDDANFQPPSTNFKSNWFPIWRKLLYTTLFFRCCITVCNKIKWCKSVYARKNSSLFFKFSENIFTHLLRTRDTFQVCLKSKSGSKSREKEVFFLVPVIIKIVIYIMYAISSFVCDAYILTQWALDFLNLLYEV